MCLSAANAAPHSEALSSILAELQYQNQYDQKLVAHCPEGDGMYRVHSVHNNKREDRVWQWDCHHILKSGYHILKDGYPNNRVEKPTCRKTGYVNSFDKPMHFNCDSNQYIAGVESYHDNGREDRRWKFTCCSAFGHKTYSCYKTGYVNEFDEELNFQAEYNEVITGVYSYHDNGRE